MIPLRYLPNLITGLRIAAAPVLLVFSWNGQHTAFAWLLAAALVSDIIDGAIARHLGCTSALGSLLDSIADILLFVVAAVGIWSFYPLLIEEHLVGFVLLVVLWIGGSLAGYLRYKRMASFHTYLARVSAYVLGAFLGVLFLWGFQSWLFQLAVGLSVIAHLEEFALMALLSEWTPNARGLYWVLKSKRQQKATP